MLALNKEKKKARAWLIESIPLFEIYTNVLERKHMYVLTPPASRAWYIPGLPRGDCAFLCVLDESP